MQLVSTNDPLVLCELICLKITAEIIEENSSRLNFISYLKVMEQQNIITYTLLRFLYTGLFCRNIQK